MKKIENKVAVITGGGSGIGEAIAKKFASEGAKVVLFGRTLSGLERVAAEIGEQATYVQGDVKNLADLDQLYQHVVEQHGRVDIVIANAGIAKVIPHSLATQDAFDDIINVNLRGVYFTIQKASNLFKNGGAVVIISSGLDVKAAPGYSIYSASKAAVRSLARSFALEMAPLGIRINSLAPGPITTPIMSKQGIPLEQMEGAFEQFKSVIPLNRIGKPEEMATAALFLASEDSSYITASALYADGGFSQV